MLDAVQCPDLAVPVHVMQHVVRVESGFNPYAIGVVRGRLQRQPRNLPEAVATARMLEQQGYNFSVGLAQVNRYNLARQGLNSYEKAFSRCDSLRAGSRILRECQQRGGDWARALSCYYSGNFTTGFRHGYVQKVMATLQPALAARQGGVLPIPVLPRAPATQPAAAARSVPAPLRPSAAPPDQPAAAYPAGVQPAVAYPADASFVF